MAEPMGTDPMNLRNPTAARCTPPGDPGGDDNHYAAPLSSSRSGRLRFMNGAHRIVIRADLYMRGLYHARFENRMPTVGVQGATVTIQYPRVLCCDWLDCQSQRPAEVALNASISWDVEVRGGASRLVADMRGLRLGLLSLDGGASRVEVVLPTPSGTVAVVILGGASNVAIRRPESVAARLHVDGGATNLKFDDKRISAAGGELDLQGRDYDRVADRYDLIVTGGTNNLNIDKQPAARDQGVGVSASDSNPHSVPDP